MVETGLWDKAHSSAVCGIRATKCQMTWGGKWCWPWNTTGSWRTQQRCSEATPAHIRHPLPKLQSLFSALDICLHKSIVLSKGSLLKISLCFKCFESDCINLHDSCHNTWKLAMLMMDTQHFSEISLQWELRGKARLARPQNLRRTWNTAKNIFMLCLNNWFYSMRNCARNSNYIHVITLAQGFACRYSPLGIAGIKEEPKTE